MDRNGHAPPTHPSAQLALWVITAALFASVVALGLLVYHGNQPLGIDNRATTVFHKPLVSRVLDAARLSPDGPPSRGVYLGRSVLLLVGALTYVGLIVASWRAGDRRAVAICIVGPLVAFVLTEEVLKPLIHRQKGGGGLAFPSGHATVAAAIAGSVIVVALRRGGWRAAILCAPLAALLPVGLGLAVVRLGYHYPTDVAGGTAFGLAVVFGLAAALPRQRRLIATREASV